MNAAAALRTWLFGTVLVTVLSGCSIFSDSPSIGSSSGASSSGIDLVVTCDTPCDATSKVTVAFHGLAGNPQDVIAFAPQGSPIAVFIAGQGTGGTSSGSLEFHHLPINVPLVARAYVNGMSDSAPFETTTTITIAGDSPKIWIACAEPCNRDSAVTIHYDHLRGYPYELVLLTPEDGDDLDRIAVLYPDPSGTGDFVLNTNLPPGASRLPGGSPLVARVIENSGSQWQTTWSDDSGPPVILTPIDRSILVDCHGCTQTSEVDVTFTNLPGYVFDLVTVIPVDRDFGGEPFPSQYTGAVADGVLKFQNLVAGTLLEARAYRIGHPEVLARSAPFTLSGTKSTLSVECPAPDTLCKSTPRVDTNGAPTAVTVHFANMPGYWYDAITFAPADSPLDNHLALMQFTDAQITGDQTYSGLPGKVRLVARAFRDYAVNGLTQLVATSDPFTLTSTDDPGLKATCLETPCRRSSTVRVRFTNFPGYLYDTITFYRAGTPLGNGFTTLNYTLGAIDGTMDFTDLPSGKLVARSFKNADFSALVAESNAIDILPDQAAITVSCAPHCTTIQDVVATTSRLQSFFYNMIYAYTFPARGPLSSTLVYTQAESAGVYDFGRLPIGNYVVGSDLDVSFVAQTESAPFSVLPATPVCGDGVRDPSTEECDDGNGVDGDACSATCKVVALAAAPRPVSTGVPLSARTLGEGRHPMAARDTGFAVAFMQAEPTPSLSLAAFSAAGVSLDVPLPIGDGTAPLAASNAVVAALPGGRYAVAWTDLASGSMGDGDGQGIALRLVDPAGPQNAVTHANALTAFSQFDPDILFTGTDVVVAWVDESSIATKLDVKYRIFSPTLSPRGGESMLAATVDSESDIALSQFAGSWAAAWRVAGDAGESIHVKAGALDWTVGPFLAGPAGVKPALAPIDDTRMLLVLTEGVDVGNTGVANGTKLQVAILDTTKPGAVIATDVFGSAGATGANRPSLVRVGQSMFLAWESAAQSPVIGRLAWIKEVPSTPTGLDWTRVETPLALEPGHRIGDQQHPALCATWSGIDGAVLAGWDDLGKSFGNSKGEVAVQLSATSLLGSP